MRKMRSFTTGSIDTSPINSPISWREKYMLIISKITNDNCNKNESKAKQNFLTTNKQKKKKIN